MVKIRRKNFSGKKNFHRKSLYSKSTIIVYYEINKNQ